jgi:hypothetical protein
MIEPVEAEFAYPPIFSNAQEEALREEDVEVLGRVTSAGDRRTSTGESTVIHRDPIDVEKAGGRIIVDFEPGMGENPHEWGKGRKW